MSKTLFQALLKKHSPFLLDIEREKMANYLFLLSKWNRAYNLTAITDPEEMVIKHILDSLSISPYLNGQKIIDIGTGAGLPGIPLSIINPKLKFTLLDSNKKKISFLKQTLLVLCLENIEIIDERAEKYHTEICFDTVITRAFSSINDIILHTKHLCCKNGVFLAMKGRFPEEELKKVEPGFKVTQVEKLSIPGMRDERHLIIIKPIH